MSGYYGPHNILNQQKRRHFIYSPGVNRTATSPACLEGTSNKHELSKTTATSPQPRKKHKSSHSVYARTEQLAAEEVCRDLPLDAFDDDLECNIEDDNDMDDDILTAAGEQLDEIERAASLEIESADVPSIGNPNCSYVQNEYKNLLHCATTPSEYSSGRAHVQHPSAQGLDKSDKLRSMKPFLSSDKNEKSHQPIPTPLRYSSVVPQTGKETMDHSLDASRSEFLNETTPLFSSKSHLTGVSCYSNSHLDDKSVDFHGNVQEDNAIVQTLKRKIEDLTNEGSLADEKVQALQEETLGKAGEIRILRDSLEHFRVQEMKRQKEKRDFEEHCTREQSEREKDLEKQLDSLTSRFQFKEREITQMIEQNKKLTATAANDSITGSPVNKSSKLGEAFPSGNSFFQRTSPHSAKSLKVRPVSREGRTCNSERSENSVDTNVSDGTSSSFPGTALVRKPTNSCFEKQLMQFKREDCPQVDFVQKLLAVQDGNTNHMCWTYDTASADDDSFLSVLKFDSRLLQSLQCEQTSMNSVGDDVCVPQTLQLIETQLASNVPNEDRGHRQALSGLYTLLSEIVMNNHSQNSTFLLRGPHSCLDMAKNMLPLLESHTAAYVEERTRTRDDSLSSTCQPRNSPSPDSGEQREETPSETDQLERLACLCEVAVKSLRLLNILLLYSGSVREVILDCCNEGQNKRLKETRLIQNGNGATLKEHPVIPDLGGANVLIKSVDDPQFDMAPVKTSDTEQLSVYQGVVPDMERPCEMLSCLAKLLVPEPNEPPVVVQTVLQVFLSLAQNCSMEQLTRLLFLLSDGLLSQSISKDWSVTTLSLVISILTTLASCTNVLEKLCSQPDECILLKIYQALLYVPEDLPMVHVRILHEQVIALLNNLWSNDDSSLSFLLETECQCSLEFMKCLVLVLNREVKTVSALPVESLPTDADGSSSVALLRTGMFFLIALCTHNRLQSEHRAEVEHQYVSLLNSVTRLYKRITAVISDGEVLALQDLLDFERIEEIDWAQESEEDEDEIAEGMEVDS